MWDKANHFLAYALGGWLAAGAIRRSRPSLSTTWVLVAAVVLIAAFGILDETVQEFTPGRYGGDYRDWVADVLGAVTGSVLSTGVGLRRR